MQLLQKNHLNFWWRWEKEHLHTLHQRGKWLVKGLPPEIRRMILVKDENNSPPKWTLARIMLLHSGGGNISKNVSIKTATGLSKRPSIKLCPLQLFHILITIRIKYNIFPHQVWEIVYPLINPYYINTAKLNCDERRKLENSIRIRDIPWGVTTSQFHFPNGNKQADIENLLFI